jgi:hypothetical protein
MGCEGIRTTLVKGPVHQAIDALVNRDSATCQAFLHDLQALQPLDSDHTEAYLALLARYIPHLTENIVGMDYSYNYSSLDYLHDAWYNPSDTPKPRPPRVNINGFWPAPYHPTEPVIRLGLIKAIELTIEANLPLTSYWIAAGDKFETLIVRDTQQVTRLIMTPPTPPPSRPAQLWNAAHVWVVKHGVQEEPWERLERQSGAASITKLNMM